MVSALVSHTIFQKFSMLSGIGPYVAMYALSFRGLLSVIQMKKGKNNFILNCVFFVYSNSHYIDIVCIDILFFLCLPW